MKVIYHEVRRRGRKTPPNKYTLVILFALMLACGPALADEGDPRDITQGYNGGNVHVSFNGGAIQSFQTKAEADAYGNAQTQAFMQGQAAKEQANEAKWRAQDNANIEQHIAQSRQGTENFKQSMTSTIIADSGDWQNGLSTDEQDKQRDIKIKQAKADADKLQAAHEAEIKENTKKEKAATEARQKAMRPLVSFEAKEK